MLPSTGVVRIVGHDNIASCSTMGGCYYALRSLVTCVDININGRILQFIESNINLKICF